MIALFALAATEAGHEGPGATPYLVGGTALLILLALLFFTLAVGKGREHS